MYLYMYSTYKVFRYDIVLIGLPNIRTPRYTVCFISYISNSVYIVLMLQKFPCGDKFSGWNIKHVFNYRFDITFELILNIHYGIKHGQH